MGEEEESAEEDGGDEAGEEKMSPENVRRQVYNQDTEGFNLVRLAAILDRPDIFLAVVSRAKEKVLHMLGVDRWRAEVGKRQSAAAVAASTFRQQGFTTLLQLCLLHGAQRVARLLMDGGADKALFGWMDAPSAWASLARRPRSKRFDGQDGLERWLLAHLQSQPEAKAELHSRLIGPSALDSRGRNSIFYVPTGFLPEFLALGPETVGALEHATPEGVTPLLAAALLGSEQRVLALMQAGCCVTATCSKRKLNVLHLAVLGGTTPRSEGKWERPRRVVEAVLGAVGPEVAEQLLLAPEAEHTPLMLAVQSQADKELLQLLVARTAASAAPALARRDGKMSSALHLAAVTTPPHTAAAEVLLEAVEKAGPEVAGVVHVAAENARGATPLELVMDAVAQVWEPASREQAVPRPHHQFNPYSISRGARMKARPKSKAKEPQASEAHKCYAVLEAAADRSRPGHRSMVPFDVVQEAARKGTEQAEKALLPARSAGPGGQDDTPAPGAFALVASPMRFSSSRVAFPRLAA